MNPIQTSSESQNGPFKSSLYLWNGYAMFLGDHTDSSVHQHHAVQIVIGLNQPVQLYFQNDIHLSHVAIIAADYPHKITSNADWHVVIMLNPEREATRKLVARHLANRPFRLLGFESVAPLVPTLQDFIGRTHSADSAKRLCDDITGMLSGLENKIDMVDDRIQKALNLLNQLTVKKIALKDIARTIGLSEGRLVHLFKEQVGIPIRRYGASHTLRLPDLRRICRRFRRLRPPEQNLQKNVRASHVGYL